MPDRPPPEPGLVEPGIDILFVGYGDWHLWSWDGFRTRSAQLCRFLSRSPRVSRLFVLNEAIYLRTARAGLSLPRKQRLRALPLLGGFQRAPGQDKVFLVDPPKWLAGPEWFKRPYYVRLLRTGLRKLASRPVLWIANVHKAYLMTEIDAGLRVFDAIDDWESVAEYGKFAERIRHGYGLVRERADLIYTVSRYLGEKFAAARTREVHHLPNGVDLELFSEPAPPPVVRRKERRGRHRVLSYVGVISERFDPDTVERVAGDWPDCSIRLIGPVAAGAEGALERVRSMPNVQWQGLVHHSQVPSILREADVLLIPHRQTRLSLSMDPLKLYEYLTTGLPIVTTPVPPSDTFADWVYIGSGEGFSKRVGEALGEVDLPRAATLWEGRIREARRHGWEARVDRILSDLERLLKKPSGP